MRLWHYKMIELLPTKQLVGQLRECLAISSVLERDGEIKHRLVNKVTDYPLIEFGMYCQLVVNEMFRRDFKVSEQTIDKLKLKVWNFENIPDKEELIIFKDWHNDRYLRQCMYYFEEKYDCKMITNDEWENMLLNFGYLMAK